VTSITSKNVADQLANRVDLVLVEANQPQPNDVSDVVRDRIRRGARLQTALILARELLDRLFAVFDSAGRRGHVEAGVREQRANQRQERLHRLIKALRVVDVVVPKNGLLGLEIQ
jgi:hypothetical protein